MIVRDKDSESDYGYDFSPEDEEALIQLASIHDSCADTGQTGPNSVIDALPGKTDSVAGDDIGDVDRDIPQDECSRQRQPGARISHTAGGAEEQAIHARSLPSPVSLAEDISYPDCTLPKSNTPFAEAD